MYLEVSSQLRTPQGTYFWISFMRILLNLRQKIMLPPDVRIELICFEFLWLIKAEKSGEFTIESPPSTKIWDLERVSKCVLCNSFRKLEKKFENLKSKGVSQWRIPLMKYTTS